MARLTKLCTGVFALVIIGCGTQSDSNRPAVVKVIGTVTYRGQPVQDATVLFAPTVEPGHAATGLTDSSGTYRLRTFSPDDGAVPGDYRITVSKFDMSTADPEKEGDLANELENDASDVLVGPTSLLPKRYSEIETTDLTAKVTPSDENTVPLVLND